MSSFYITPYNTPAFMSSFYTHKLSENRTLQFEKNEVCSVVRVRTGAAHAHTRVADVSLRRPIMCIIYVRPDIYL